MIYCREKLVDIILGMRWITIEERIDFEIGIETCISRGYFTQSEWSTTEEFLSTGVGYTDRMYTILCQLADVLGYTDDNYLKDKTELQAAYYNKLEKGVRL